MNELVVFAGDPTNKDLMLTLVLISAIVIIVIFFLIYKGRKQGK